MLLSPRSLKLPLPATLSTLAFAFAFALPGVATGTTFCVPDFHADCPDNGSNVAEANVQTAMTTNASDGQADRIVIAPGTFTVPGSYIPTGTDSLTVQGAGPGQTILTSSNTGNIILFNLNQTPGKSVVVRDLEISVPASFPNMGGSGAALQMGPNAHLRNVDLVNRNDAISAGKVDPSPARKKFKVRATRP